MAPIRIRQFTFSTLFKTALIFALLGLIAWYGFFQAHSLITGPQITLESPISTLQETKTVIVRGHTQNITELTLNGKVIHTNEAGYFDELLVLPDGYTIMTLHAKDRYGRKTTLSKPLVYQEMKSITQLR